MLPTTSLVDVSRSFFLPRYTIVDAAYLRPVPPPISLVGIYDPTNSYTWLVTNIGILALANLSVSTLNAALMTCALVISLVSLPSEISSNFLVVDNRPNESNTNINGGLLSSGVC